MLETAILSWAVWHGARMKHIVLTLVWLLPLALVASEPVQVEVYLSGQDGYHTYRIPAIVRTQKGTLLAFAEGRRHSARDWGDIDVLVKRSTDGGLTWSSAITVADLGEDTVGNPAPVVDRRTGTIWLLLTRNPGQVRERDILPGLSGPTRTVWLTYSKDDGRSWAPPVEITAAVKRPEWSWYATGPVNGIQLRSGRLVIPCDHVVAGDLAQRFSHVIYSDDGGKTWRVGGSAGPDCNESTVVELSDGALMLNMRSYAGKNRRAVSLSRDGGLTWSPPQLDETLIEPVCQASLIRFGKKRPAMLLFSNPASTRRVNMTIRLSRDEGKSWTAAKTIHEGPSAYSNLVELKGNMIGLLYERGDKGPYERITFARLSLRWLTQP